MPAFALHVAPRGAVDEEAGVEHFYWPGSFVSTVSGRRLGPSLGQLGQVQDQNIDLVRIALAVVAADRSVKRDSGGSNWNSRQFQVQVPVSNPTMWRTAASALAGLVGFLTGDTWTFSFVSESYTGEPIALHTWTLNRVVLLSGGADSVVGALLTRDESQGDERHALISHYSSSWIAPAQRRLVDELKRLRPGPESEHFQFHLNRNQKRQDGTAYYNEPSSRSRSLLFLALGLAVASVDRVQLWVPENGFASLNPPLGPNRLGSLSTRTTHPAFLEGLMDVLSLVGGHNDLRNPFATQTKGEMFQLVKDMVGQDDAVRMFATTNSCAHTGHAGPRPSPSLACGVCYGCVVRRAAFKAAGIEDATPYVDPNASEELRKYVERETIVPAVRSFVARGVRDRDLLAMSLPASLQTNDAGDLCARGVAELKDYVQ